MSKHLEKKSMVLCKWSAWPYNAHDSCSAYRQVFPTWLTAAEWHFTCLNTFTKNSQTELSSYFFRVLGLLFWVSPASRSVEDNTSCLIHNNGQPSHISSHLWPNTDFIAQISMGSFLAHGVKDWTTFSSALTEVVKKLSVCISQC